MPQAPTRACQHCGKPALPGKWLCADHETSARKEYDGRRTSRLYNKNAWKQLRAALLSLNPICQVIEPNGEQCRRPSHVGHHVKDHEENTELFFAWANLVAICDRHHSNKLGEETRYLNFVPTIGMLGDIFEHATVVAPRTMADTIDALPAPGSFYVSAYPNSQTEPQRAQVQPKPPQVNPEPTTRPGKGISWGED